jgi:VanZ family protein
MPRRTFAGILWFALLCWACGVLWLSSLTPMELPDVAFLVSDKINHLAVFAVGGWLAASALRVSRPMAAVAGRIVLAVVIIATFGALDESLQLFIPGRMGGDIYDWIADVLGGVAGALLSLATHQRLERLLSQRSVS